MIEVDLVAPILLTRAALPALRPSGDGLVVKTSLSTYLLHLLALALDREHARVERDTGPRS
jgi:hypothetical protein